MKKILLCTALTMAFVNFAHAGTGCEQDDVLYKNRLDIIKSSTVFTYHNDPAAQNKICDAIRTVYADLKNIPDNLLARKTAFKKAVMAAYPDPNDPTGMQLNDLVTPLAKQSL